MYIYLWNVLFFDLVFCSFFSFYYVGFLFVIIIILEIYFIVFIILSLKSDDICLMFYVEILSLILKKLNKLMFTKM